MPKINARHKDYASMVNQWMRIDAAIAGEDAVKALKVAALPMPNAMDISLENQQRYDSYLQRAVWHAVSGRTLSNMVGQVFSIAPTSQLPGVLDELNVDVDGSGVNLAQQAKQTLSHVISKSRCGLFVDYPTTEGVTTIADQQTNGIRPIILIFDPICIINWRMTKRGALSQLSLVVIESDYVSNDDGFEVAYETEWKALRLLNGVYTVEVWRKVDDDFVKFSSVTPTNGAGKTMTEIPFIFVGVDANDYTVEKPLLGDIVSLNYAHFRDSADYQEAVYMLGQPTPFATGLTDDWIKRQLGGAISLGSRNIVPLPENATMGLLQVSPNTLPKEAMDQKEEQMQSLGAMLVERKKVAITATEAGINDAAETSILSACANNVTAAYCHALVFAGAFANVDVPNDPINPIFELNTDFAVSRLNPNEVKATLDAYNGGLISFTEARDKLKRGGYAFEEDEIVKGEIDQKAEADLQAAMAQAQAAKPVIVPAGGKPTPAKKTAKPPTKPA